MCFIVNEHTTKCSHYINIQLGYILIHILSKCQYVALFIEEVNPSVAKLPLELDGLG